MEFRKAIYADVDRIMDIIKDAQDYFKSKGIDQWQNNYPNYETIKEDILTDSSYVLVDKEVTIGTVSLSFDGEKTYEEIYEGKWLSNEDYAVIHRMAIDLNYKGSGLASEIVEKIEKMCLDRGVYSIKVDTHMENLPMKRVLIKNGFDYCGLIYTEDKSLRVAFEKVLLKNYKI